MDSTRREFLKTTAAAGALAVTAGGSLSLAETTAGKSEVFVGKGKAEATILNIFDKLGGIKRFVKPQARVVIKPNMGFAGRPQPPPRQFVSWQNYVSTQARPA
jgi:hypothetical protein